MRLIPRWLLNGFVGGFGESSQKALRARSGCRSAWRCFSFPPQGTAWNGGCGGVVLRGKEIEAEIAVTAKLRTVLPRARHESARLAGKCLQRSGEVSRASFGRTETREVAKDFLAAARD